LALGEERLHEGTTHFGLAAGGMFYPISQSTGLDLA
jgi:hypothetical protein